MLPLPRSLCSLLEASLKKMIRVGRTLKTINEIRVQNTQTLHLPPVKNDTLEVILVVGASIATRLSRKSSRSDWRKTDRKKKAKDEDGEERFHARGGQPPKVPSYKGHADSQTFQAFERAVEIWVSRAEHYIPPQEQGLALLDALTGGEPGTYLQGKPWQVFRVKNFVKILMILLRPHYEADKLQIQARVLND